jgi:hypothetical protein
VAGRIRSTVKYPMTHDFPACSIVPQPTTLLTFRNFLCFGCFKGVFVFIIIILYYNSVTIVVFGGKNLIQLSTVLVCVCACMWVQMCRL